MTKAIKFSIRSSIIIGLFLFVGCTPNRENDLDVLGYKGTVKSVRVENFELYESFGELQEGRRPLYEENSHYHFNREGFLTEHLRYNANNQLVARALYRYDSEFNTKILDVYSPDGALKSKTRTELNKNGKPIKIQFFDSDGNLQRTLTSQFDSKGRIINEEHIDLEGAVRRTVFKYESGNLIEKADLGEDGGYISGSTYYFKDGNLEKEIFHGNFEKREKIIGNKTIYKYENGNLAESIVNYDNGDIKLRIKYKYEDDKLVEREWFDNQQRDGLFGRYGNPRPAFTYIDYYKYDDLDNCIEKINYLDGKPKNVEKSTFEYYEN